MIVFMAMHLLPGDIVDLIAGDVITSAEVKEALREELGLNDPLVVQYGRWALSMLKGDFGGQSLFSGQSIGDLLARQLPVTLLLAVYTVILSFVAAVSLGILAALKQNCWQDYFLRLIALPGQALPNFWLALLLLLGLMLLFRWSPPLVYTHPWENPWNHLQIIFLPVLLLVWEFGSHILRVTRASVLGTMQEDHIIAARAKGLSENQIIVKHALRAAAAPIITVMGLQFGVLLGGTMILESVFGLPGIGRGLVQAALARDFPVVQSYVIVVVFAILLVNLIVDVLYRALDPRISNGQPGEVKLLTSF
ncbi:ABC transporter permease [Dehalogenimonas sp. THU2]|uniref:ABC transporter permease n=1 Tax=Dehalogenimonas sp. THU2 TaxID=3151121 RepID=UPI003218AE3E